MSADPCLPPGNRACGRPRTTRQSRNPCLPLSHVPRAGAAGAARRGSTNRCVSLTGKRTAAGEDGLRLHLTPGRTRRGDLRARAVRPKDPRIVIDAVLVLPRLGVHAECASSGRVQTYSSDEAQESAVREPQDRLATRVVASGENGLQGLRAVSRQADRRVSVGDSETEEQVDVALEVAERLAATRQASVTRLAQRGNDG